MESPVETPVAPSIDPHMFARSALAGHRRRSAVAGKVMLGLEASNVPALGILQTYATNIVGQRVMRDLRDRLYTHLQSLSLGFFTGTRTG